MSIKTEFEMLLESAVLLLYLKILEEGGVWAPSAFSLPVLFKVPSGPNSSQMGDGQALFGS